MLPYRAAYCENLLAGAIMDNGVSQRVVCRPWRPAALCKQKIVTDWQYRKT